MRLLFELDVVSCSFYCGAAQHSGIWRRAEMIGSGAEDEERRLKGIGGGTH